MKRNFIIAAATVGSIAMGTTALAAPGDIYAEGFDSQAGAKVSTSQFGEATVDYVDYSNFMTPFGGTFSVTEAPNTVPGSASTSGVLVTVNSSQGVASGINLFALQSAGGTALNLSDDYILSYDVYGRIATGSTTQQALWGIGSDATGTTSRTNRGPGGVNDGTWGWGALDGGWGASGDYNVWLGDSDNAAQAVGVSTDGSGGDAAPTAAFPAPPYEGIGFLADADGGVDAWATLQVVVTGGQVNVFWNDVLFFTEAANSPDGTVLLGVEDSFASIVDNPANQFFLFDNFTVSTIPEPASLGLLGLGGLTLLRRRR